MRSAVGIPVVHGREDVKGSCLSPRKRQAPAPRGAAGPVEGGERLVGAVLMAETA